MKLLLDTHTFLWFIAGDSQLDRYSRRLIEDTRNQRYLSVVSGLGNYHQSEPW